MGTQPFTASYLIDGTESHRKLIDRITRSGAVASSSNSYDGNHMCIKCRIDLVEPLAYAGYGGVSISGQSGDSAGGAYPARYGTPRLVVRGVAGHIKGASADDSTPAESRNTLPN